MLDPTPFAKHSRDNVGSSEMTGEFCLLLNAQEMNKIKTPDTILLIIQYFDWGNLYEYSLFSQNIVLERC